MLLDNSVWQLAELTSVALSADDFSQETVSQFFSEKKNKALVVVDHEGYLKGLVSRGDFLKSLGSEPTRLNKDPFVLRQGHGSKTGSVADLNFIPVIDERRRVTKVLERTESSKPSKALSPEGVFTVAEIGNNHNGSEARARELVELAAKANASAVKFQIRDLERTYIATDENFLRNTDYGTAYTVRQLQKFNLEAEVIYGLMEYARSLGLMAFATPFDNHSLQFLLSKREPLIKIASADLSNYEFQEMLGQYTGHLLMSTGMHAVEDITRTSLWAKDNFVDVTFLHTNSTYPTPYEDVNLSFMPTLKAYSTTGKVGYSGHERGIHVPAAAVALGAKYVEKHFTTDRSLFGNDHKVSLLPNEFATMAKDLAEISSALGVSHSRPVSQGETLNRISLSKGIYLKKDVKAGDVLTPDTIELKSPCVGIAARAAADVLQRQIVRDMRKGDYLNHSDFKVENQAFDRSVVGTFGFPVRMRDVEDIWQRLEPTFVEYHLFSTDVELDPRDYADRLKGKTFKVHAPEQYDDGFIVDFVNDDPEIRAETHKRFLAVFEWVDRLREVLDTDAPIELVTNMGGAKPAMEAPSLPQAEQFQFVAQAIDLAESRGVCMLPQTMPPEPWHFGGQGFHTLFVDLDDLIAIQKLRPVQFCFDTSHSWLATAKSGQDFYSKVKEVSEYIRYLHIADAKAPGGEGMQLGEGEIDLARLFSILDLNKTPYIPEIWNGHFEDFTGFKKAMKEIENVQQRIGSHG